MEEIVFKTLLFDFYGDLLNEHQKRVYDEAIFQDLSLSEIAETEGITRQGVHDLLRRTERTLREYEDKLHLVERFESMRGKAETILELSDDEEIRKLARELIDEM